MSLDEQEKSRFEIMLDEAMSHYLKRHAKGVRFSDEELAYLRLTTRYDFWRFRKHLAQEDASKRADLGGDYPNAFAPEGMTTPKRVGLERRAVIVSNILDRLVNPPKIVINDTGRKNLKEHQGFVHGGIDTGTTLGFVKRGTDPRIFEGSADGLGDHPADEDY